jgi:hypothetical protein
MLNFKKNMAIIAIFTVLFLVGCGGEKPKPIIQNEKPAPVLLSPEEQLKVDISDKIKTELGTAKKMNNLLAGFEFGMNVKNVERHTLKMTERKVLRKVKKSKNRMEYVYQLPVQDKRAKVDAFMEAEYIQGGLSKLSCYTKVPSSTGSNDYLKLISNLFTEWYGAPSFKLPAYNSCERIVWITGNKYIELRCELNAIHFDYTDLTVITPASFDAANNNQLDIKDVSKK